MRSEAAGTTDGLVRTPICGTNAGAVSAKKASAVIMIGSAARKSLRTSQLFNYLQ